jgi:hypothetical protein
MDFLNDFKYDRKGIIDKLLDSKHEYAIFTLRTSDHKHRLRFLCRTDLVNPMLM